MIAYLINLDLVDSETWVRAIIPFACETYWYYSAYFVLFFFIPYLNCFVEKTEKKILYRLLFTMFIVLSVVPTLVHRDFAWMGQGYKFPWLVVMYLFGCVLKKYRDDYSISRKTCVIWFFISIAFTWVWDIALEIVTTLLLGESHFGRLFIKYTSPTIIVASISLLLFFSTLGTNNTTKWISKNISPLAFGIHLVHEEPLIREWLIQNRFVWVCNYSIIVMILLIVMISTIVFIIGLSVDFCRMKLFEIANIRIVSEKIAESIRGCLQKYLRILYDK